MTQHKTFRKEKDAMGIVMVPADKYWGVQTQRSLNNFKIGQDLMPGEVIKAYALLKKAAAMTNYSKGKIDKIKKELIVRVCDEIFSGKLDAHFPLLVWQTGSGTQTNMNVNEVIANRAHILHGGKIDDGIKILHPNDDVNMSQSSNDTFPTAMHIAAYSVIFEKTIPALGQLSRALKDKEEAFRDIIKLGRTHLMDATPITLGQEFSAFQAQIDRGIRNLAKNLQSLAELPLGGTSVGTGMNAPKDFDKEAVKHIADFTGYPLTPMPNKFEAIAAHDVLVETSGTLKTIAVSLMKIANDLRLLASGPRCGIGEIELPANEPGSSMMPGKVNPTQCEAMAMVCSQVIGCDAAITAGGMQGHLQLNTFKPLIIHNLLWASKLIADAVSSFTEKCIVDIKPHKKRINEHLDNALMLVTALSSHIGYDKAAQIAKRALTHNIPLKKAAIESGFVSSEDYDNWVDVQDIV